ncbi:sensor histidine kinase [Telmatospirillum sp. J64-1]|uniref:sensor histidine kinase n=1 Tax=Telmatospirillum sp. J64-1 TaxID=2502183 RepID=UPI00115F2444|nr:sensor histidine kinase [Telmatospirillum sp. J64-1]
MSGSVIKGMRSWSIRRRLLAWLLVPLIGGNAIMLLEARITAIATADEVFDRLLLASAMAITERVVVDDGEVEVDLPYVALEILSSTSHDRVYYRVAGPEDSFVTGYPDLPPPPRDLVLRVGEPSYYDAVYRNERVRIVVIGGFFSDRRSSGNFSVQVAQTRWERSALADAMVLRSALRQGILVVLACLVVWIAVSRGLAPLNRLQGALSRRTMRDLRPVEGNVPEEVRALVAALNHLLARLDSGMRSMQRFIADAAHQLRTPLATLRTEAELGLADSDPQAAREALKRLHEGTLRTSRLANQLLSLARLESGMMQAGGMAPTDLARLAADTARNRVLPALEAGIDLGFEQDNGNKPLLIRCNPLLVEEMLGNLIDNAQAYAGSGACVTVRVRRDGDRAVLEVDDDGPGIPADQRGQVLEPFRRGHHRNSEGCGLGLAIVKEIADLHQAELRLEESGQGGLRVSIAFPLEETA